MDKPVPAIMTIAKAKAAVDAAAKDGVKAVADEAAAKVKAKEKAKAKAASDVVVAAVISKETTTCSCYMMKLLLPELLS